MSPIRVLPNAEALLVAFLRADPDVSAIAGQRGYTAALPPDPDLPCFRVTRWGGVPAVGYPLVLDTASMQVDAWASTNTAAQALLATIRAVMAERMPGKHPTGVVTRVDFGPMSDAPDTTFDPPRPRYVADVTITYRGL